MSVSLTAALPPPPRLQRSARRWLACTLGFGVWVSGCGRIGIEFLDLPESHEDAANDGGIDALAAGEGEADGRGSEATSSEAGEQAAADAGAEPTDGGMSHPTDAEPADASETAASACGADTDSDLDGVCDAVDGCPNDAAKTAPGVCGCGVTPPPGLLGTWSFNASAGTLAADTSGNHPGTLTNMAGTEWVAGRVGNALHFDGTNDYVNVGAVSSSARSLSFWIKADSFGVTSDQTGWLSPTATGAPNNQWSDPTRAYLKDGSSATTSTLIGARAQDWSGFGVRMPSTTTGIEAKLDLPGGAGLLTNTQVDFSWNAGASYSSVCSDAALLNLGADSFVCGNATSLWAHSPWTQAELGEASFRVRIRFGGLLSSISLDQLQVNVHYTAYTEPRSILQLSASAQVELAGQSLHLVGFAAGTLVYVDRAVASALDSAYHHVVIVSPTAINVSALQIGRAAAQPLSFDGSLDELKVFSQPLSTVDVNTLFVSSACL